ncbi:MAG: two-component regulator propeller domain-containing protein, partial [Flammeovirgaceae bacterium]
VWLGTANGGLNRFDPSTEKFTVYKNSGGGEHNLPSNNVISIHVRKDGTIWCGTSDGLSQFNPQLNSFKAVALQRTGSTSQVEKQIISISEDHTGNLWIQNGFGVIRYTPNGNYVKRYKYLAYFVFVGGQGQVWLGTSSAGLRRYNAVSEQFEEVLNEEAIVYRLYQLKANLYFATTNAGFAFLETKAPFRTHEPNGDGENFWSIEEQGDGRLWLGTDTGVYLYNPYHSELSAKIKRLSAENVYCLFYQATTGTLWVGATNGLKRYNPQTGAVTAYQHQAQKKGSLPDNIVEVLLGNGDGTLWIGTPRGLSLFDPTTGAFTNYKLGADIESNFVNTIAKDKSGQLWVGTRNGFYHFDPRTKSVVEHKPPGGSSFYSLSILADPEGTVWIGTFSDGLTSFDPRTGLFRSFTFADGLPSNRVYGILNDDHGNFWLSTDNGICRFTPPKNEGQAKVRNFDMGDGIPGKDFNQGAFKKGKDGMLYFAGQKLLAFHPDSVKYNLQRHRSPSPTFRFSTSPAVTHSRTLSFQFLMSRTSFLLHLPPSTTSGQRRTNTPTN